MINVQIFVHSLCYNEKKDQVERQRFRESKFLEGTASRSPVLSGHLSSLLLHAPSANCVAPPGFLSLKIRTDKYA